MTGTGEFVGLENVKTAFTEDPIFYKSLMNTLYFVAVSVPLSLIPSILIAILLNKKILKGCGFLELRFMFRL